MSYPTTSPPAYTEKPSAHVTYVSDDGPTNDYAGGSSNLEDVVETFQVRYKDFKCRTALVTDAVAADSDSPTVLYSIDLRNRKPNLHIYRGEGEAEVATGIYHTLTSTKLEVAVNGSELTLKPRRLLSTDFCWDATPALGSQPLMWDRQLHFRTVEYILQDSQGQPLARLTQKSLAVRSLGSLEILRRCPRTKEAMDEVVATLLTVVQWIQVRNGMTNSTLATSSASSAAAASA
jgi:hypothetical protein